MIKLIQGDCLEEMQKLIDQGVKVDAVITDPPYTDGKGKNSLQGHKIHTKIDIDEFTKMSYKLLDENSFYAFFGQMPTIVAWHLAAVEAGFLFVDHIVWAKRTITSPYLPIQRSHEEIYIYRKGKAKYKKTTAKYEDLKTPAMYMGLYELSTIKTIISDLQRRLVERKYDELYWSKVPTGNGSMNGKSNDGFYLKSMKRTHKRKTDDLDLYIEENGLEPVERPVGVTAKYGKSPKNDEMYNKMYNMNYSKENTNDVIYKEDSYGRTANCDNFRYRSRWYCNITNVWSFLPENQKKFGVNGINIKHPTVKPTLLMERLIELLTDKDKVVFDPFMGSGTTGVACVNTNRNFIGIEKDSKYFKIAEKRIKEEQNKNGLF